MGFHGVAPRVDVSQRPAIVFQISCGAHENPSHVHELAKWKVRQKDAYKKKVNIKNYPQASWDNWVKTESQKSKSLYFKKVDPIEMSHKHSRYGNSKDEQERKIIRNKGDIAYLWIQNSP